MNQDQMCPGNPETKGAAALFADLAGLEHILLGDLRALLAEPLTETSRSWIEKVLDMLLDVLPGQFAAEEADGYLQDVVAAFPDWQPRVASLQQQHVDLYRNLAALRNELDAPDFVQARAARVRKGLREWMQQYQSHQDAEMRLLNADGVATALAS